MLENLFVSILNMSLIGSYVIVFVLIARLLLKKAPKIFSYALWSIVLFRLLCPFSFESVLSLIPMAKTPIPQDIIHSTLPQINTGINIVDNSINPILSAPNVGDSVNPLQIWIFIGTIIWVLGMLAMLIYSVIAFVKLKKSIVGSAQLKDNIYLADHISSPFVMGIIKPKIYLPSSLSDSEKDFIITHEMCHIKRFDHITRILGFVALSIHWFNPLVWASFILSEKDMELSCDEAVMKKMNTDIRIEYSQSLLRFATSKKTLHATPLAFGEGDTKSRVKNVLNYRKPAFWVIVITTIAVVVAVFCLVSNPVVTTIQNPYVQEYIVGIDGILGSVDTEKYTAVSEDFAIGADKYGRAVFKDPYKAFATFETLYVDAIELIKSENDLKLFSHKNYEMYKVYGWQLTSGTKEEQDRTRFVSGFLDIYENSFEKGIPNTQYPVPTTEETNGVSAEKLWENRTEYVGNNSAVGNIISNLSFPNDISYKDFELHTKERPYAITVNFKTDTETRNYYAGELHQQEFKDNALIIFSLVENVDYVTFSLDDDVLEPYSFQCTSDQAKMVLGKDYLEQTKTIDGFRNILDIISQNNPPLTHDQAVSTAILSLANEFPVGECVAEGHIILGYDDSYKNKTKIYALTEMRRYGFENGNFVALSGSAFPAVITLFSDNHVEIEEPLDGGNYAKSIKKMFPKEYHDKVLKHNDTERENLKQQREKYASEYLSKIGRNAKIGEMSDFEYAFLTNEGVSVEVSNKLQYFYKAHVYYPLFIGNKERLENGVHVVYEMRYDKSQGEICFTKYDYDTNKVIEQFIADAKTGNIVE